MRFTKKNLVTIIVIGLYIVLAMTILTAAARTFLASVKLLLIALLYVQYMSVARLVVLNSL